MYHLILRIYLTYEKRGGKMILGDPYKFAIFIETIKEWNIDDAFCNGILLFSVNGIIFPKEIVTATLKSEIRPLKEKLEKLTVDEKLFKMEKRDAFAKIYNLTFPKNVTESNDFRYDLTPYSFADNNCYVFGVSSGKQVRILSAKLKYIIEESRHELENIDISETVLSIEELNEIVLKLKIY